MTTPDSPFGLLSFLSFGISIIAAVLAIDMYKLLRTGEFGKTWRTLIIASVMFALLQVLRMARVFDIGSLTITHLAEIVELCFAITLAYAFYSQRKVFTHEHMRDAKDEPLNDEDEWPDAMLAPMVKEVPTEPASAAQSAVNHA